MGLAVTLSSTTTVTLTLYNSRAESPRINSQQKYGRYFIVLVRGRRKAMWKPLYIIHAWLANADDFCPGVVKDHYE